MYTKKIIVFMIALFMASDSFSQAALSIGPRVGIGFSSFWGDYDDIREKRTGFTGGLFLNVVAGEKGTFAIAPEMLFQRSGADVEDENKTLRNITLNYMTVPVPLKFRFPIIGTFYPNVFVGPEFSFLISDDQSPQEGVGINSNFKEIDVRKGDVGGIFGAGLDIEKKRLFFNVEFRYEIGGLKIDKSSKDPLNLKNRQFTMLVGIGVRLGK